VSDTGLTEYLFASPEETNAEDKLLKLDDILGNGFALVTRYNEKHRDMRANLRNPESTRYKNSTPEGPSLVRDQFHLMFE